MLKRLTCSGLGLGLAGSLAIVASAPAQADVVVTGGSINFQGAKIFVPTSTGQADIYNGSAAAQIVTTPVIVQQGALRVQGLVNNNILPQLNTTPGAVPAVGSTGQWQPTVSFVGLSASGEPTLFLNLPTNLNFQVNSLTPGVSSPISRYETQPFVLSQTGVGVNASSFGGVERLTPVVLVDYSSSPLTSISGAAVNSSATRPGASYSPTAFTAAITGGTITTPAGFTFGSPGSSSSSSIGSTSTSPNSGNNGSTFSTSATFIRPFALNTTTIVFITYSPTLDRPVQVQAGNNSQSGSNEGDRVTYTDTQTNQSYTPVGLPSRVFPGLIGLQQVDSRQSTTRLSTTDPSTSTRTTPSTATPPSN